MAGSIPRRGWWVTQDSQIRSGQKRRRNGNTVVHDNGKSSWWSISPPRIQRSIVRIVRCKNEKGGCEETRSRNQRRSVDGSVTRWGSLTGGAAASQEQPSTK